MTQIVPEDVVEAIGAAINYRRYTCLDGKEIAVESLSAAASLGYHLTKVGDGK